jgi:putative tryptophan/tyrosine transport system substrate-binding protein
LGCLKASEAGAKYHRRAMIVQAVSRVSLLFNPETAPFAEGYRRSAEAAAPTLGMTVVSAPCGNAAHIESAFDARAREGGGGIIGIPDTFINEHRDLIIELAAWSTGGNPMSAFDPKQTSRYPCP